MKRRERTSGATRGEPGREHEGQCHERPKIAATPGPSTTPGPTTTTPSCSKNAQTRLSLSSSSSKRSTNPLPSISEPSFSKDTTPLSSPNDPNDQTTLTQISFVSKTREVPDSDSEALDYLDEDRQLVDQGSGHRDESKAIAVNPGSPDRGWVDGSNSKARRRPSSARQPRTVRFDDDESTTEHTGYSKKTGVSEGKKALRKSVEGKRRKSTVIGANSSKGKAKGSNRTLTQMKFVKPFVVIKSDSADEDDDVKLDYISKSPRPADSKKTCVLRSVGNVEGSLSHNEVSSQQGFTGPKRRKLSDEPTANVDEINSAARKRRENPVTPRKLFRREVPSSQTPDSPGLCQITSSQFREAARSPLKDASPNIMMRPSRLRSPSPARNKQTDGAPDSDPASALHGSTLSYSHFLQNSPILGDELEQIGYATPKALSPKNPMLNTNRTLLASNDQPDGRYDSRNKATNSERTIVYETDNESQPEGFETAPIDSPLRQTDGSIRERMDQSHRHHRKLSISSEANMEPAQPGYSEELSSSCSSICHQRQHLSTQFPAGPIPLLNTQKANELFPQDSSPLAQGGAEASLRRQSLGRTSESQPQGAGQTVSRASMGKVETSSLVGSPTATNDSVVQVESSQPADWLTRLTRNSEGSSSQGMLSRSQLLPSSLMESIPVPVFWPPSQDENALEPLPDG